MLGEQGEGGREGKAAGQDHTGLDHPPVHGWSKAWSSSQQALVVLPI